MTNTAQPNQPLGQHPLPLPLKRLLGAGSTMLPDVAFGTDYLVVPPPPSSPNGAVARLVDDGTRVFLVNNDADPIPDVISPLINFALVYKTATDEVLLDVKSDGIPAGGTTSLSPQSPLLLAPTDRGIFLRRIVNVAAVPSIQAFAHFLDVRDTVRGTLSLTEALQTVLSGAQGKTRFATAAGTEGDSSIMAICNFDSVDHNVDWFLSDGVNSFKFFTSVVLANDGQNPSVQPALDLNNSPYLLEGWTLSAQLQEPTVDAGVSLVYGYTDTNLSPVRSDQGGAY